MTRFDEVARLRELQAAAKPGPWLVYNDPAIRCPTCKTEADGRYMMALTHAHWLLEVAACFQPGDAEILHLMCNYLAAHKPDGHLIENGPSTARGVDCMTRLQKAAAIMEELE